MTVLNSKLWSYLIYCFTLENQFTEAYSEPYQTHKMEHFAKMVSGFQALTIFAKHYILMFLKVVNTPHSEELVSNELVLSFNALHSPTLIITGYFS